MTLFHRHWRAIAVGFAAAALGGLLTLGLDESERAIFAGVALATIAGIYLGFAIADGRTSAIAIAASASWQSPTPIMKSTRYGKEIVPKATQVSRA